MVRMPSFERFTPSKKTVLTYGIAFAVGGTITMALTPILAPIMMTAVAASTIPYVGVAVTYVTGFLFLSTSALGTYAGYHLVAKPLIFIGEFSLEKIKALIAQVDSLSAMANKLTTFFGLTEKTETREEELQHGIAVAGDKKMELAKDEKDSEAVQPKIVDNSEVAEQGELDLQEISKIAKSLATNADALKDLAAVAQSAGVGVEMLDGAVKVTLSDNAQSTLGSALSAVAAVAGGESKSADEQAQDLLKDLDVLLGGR